MELSVLDTSIIEPIDHDEVKSFMGYPLTDTSQDDTIDRMITSAREWLEGRTALSLVSKSYKVYFEPEDAEDGWYELPVSPVTGALVVKMNDVVTTSEQKGLKKVYVRAVSIYSTIQVGASLDVNYLTIEFTAGATNGMANMILIELAAFQFNHRDDGVGLSYSRLPYDMQSRINSISMNL